MQNLLLRLQSAISRLGAVPDDTREVRQKKNSAIVLIIGFSLLFALVVGPLYFLFNEPTAGVIYLMIAAGSLLNLTLFAGGHRNFRLMAVIELAFTLLMQFVGAVVMGGLVYSSGSPLWGLLNTVAALVFLGTRDALFWFAAYILNVMAIVLLQPYLQPLQHIPAAVVLLAFGVNVIVISAFAFGALYYFVTQRDLAFQLLREEQEKAEALLLNILPKDIADILKQEQRTIAEHYDTASVLFADVVNFTPMSARMTPVELVELLNEVFSYFDSLVDKYGLEKIKTIGDCYMVAAGVPRPRADHAQALTRMALEMRDYVAQREFRGHALSFRIGLNSGPVVAGVIGRKKFIYDLWGDAVNTASRMESHGTGGTIQITRSTYDLVKDEFVCQPRGTVSVKGKGEMEVWHVLNTVD
jgi:guanylate cyclase